MKKLSIATDYAKIVGPPAPCLKEMSETGFSHIHWCHEWCTDYLYTESDIDSIKSCLDEYGLAFQDLHGTHTDRKFIWSVNEDQRQGGIELVENRIKMTGKLGGDAVVLHPPNGISDEEWDCMRKSLDELKPVAEQYKLRLAFENLFTGESLGVIRRLLEIYPDDYVGVCYDSGHGNMAMLGEDGLAFLETVKDRLLVLHLHDNDGVGDQHLLPFAGTVDWEKLCGIISKSSYKKTISMESNMRSHDITDNVDFLDKAIDAGTRLAQMCGLD